MTTIVVRLSGGPLNGAGFPTAEGRTSLRIPFRFADGSVGRVTYTKSAFSPTVFTFTQLLTPDGMLVEGAALRAAQEAKDAADRERKERAERKRREAAERQAAEDAQRCAEADRFRTAAQNEPDGPIRDLAILHSPDATSRPPDLWITCPGCDISDEYESGEPHWPCRTATILINHFETDREAR